MKILPFASRNLFLNFVFFFAFFLGSCEIAFEQAPKKETSKEVIIKYDLSDCISISPNKMNVLYIGVDNPVSISAAGVNSQSLKVSVSGGGGRLKKGIKNHYNLTVTKSGECIIKVEVNGVISTSHFRVKRIPDPVAQLGNSQGGTMGIGEFKAQGGVPAILHNFDFDAKCKIQGFILTRIPENGNRVEVVNRGARYVAEARELINEALPEDIYAFNKVKAKCPGDAAGRKINSMVFKVK